MHRFTGRRFHAAAIRFGVAIVLSIAVPSGGFGQNSGSVDLTKASLEELMAIQVTSVSKKEQSLGKTGAAVFVIKQEDIRRSGATNIPDLLRMVPGVDVARIDSNRWAVSIRGFNSLYGNKVLVLIDGRSVYLESFAGVLWDQQDVPLEDIDRIEVTRGPGGTVWGANAVNGVIDIITKNSRETRGGTISAGGGSQTAADSTVQYGGTVGSSGSYRVFGRYFDVNNSVTPQGQPAADGWHGSHGGFRSDWNLSPKDTLTVQGDVMQTTGGENVTGFFPSIPLQTTFNETVTNGLGNILARWEHSLANGSQTSLQVYYDYVHRSGEGGTNDHARTTDVEFQDHVKAGARHDLVWGIDYRFIDQAIESPLAYSGRFDPDHRRDTVAAAFLQDEIAITNSFSLTVGSKIEHNSYTGFEYEPSARIVWAPSDRQTFWASASRAIRQPSMLDYGIQVSEALVPVNGTFGTLVVTGNHSLKAEQLRDFEIGYRSQIVRKLSLDLTGFLSYYKNLETTAIQAPFLSLDSGPPHLVIPALITNYGNGRDYGAEAFVNWDVSSRLKISSGYTFLNMAVGPEASHPAAQLEQVSGDSPRDEFQVRGRINLRRNLDWDSSVAYTSPLTNVPGYFRVDSRLALRIGKALEISVVGQNLASGRHLEFIDTIDKNPTLVQRSIFAGTTLRF